ncbi:unnamed protein product, partial [marine sediment metagenome]
MSGSSRVVAVLSAFLIAFPIVLILAGPAQAGDWIRPDWSQSPPVRFPSVWVFGKSVENSPRIYRTVIDVPDRCDRATAMLRTADWACVWVDGRQVFAAGADSTADDARTRRVARNKLQWLDLSEYLTPGRHVLTVSASDRGFVLDGGLYAGTRRLADLTSSDTWTVTRFAPATVIEDQAIVTDAYDGQAVDGLCGPATAVRAVDVWTVREDTLAKVY